MKILQVVDFFKPSWEAGGIVRLCYDLSRELVQRGHDITVFATDGYKSRVPYPVHQPVDVDGIRTYFFKNISLTLAKNNFYTPYLLPWIARRELKQFDIVHIHTYRSPMGVLAGRYARIYGVPYILQAHGTVLPFFDKQGMKKLYDAIWGAPLLSGASKVIAITQEEVNQYLQMKVEASKVVKVYNVLNLDEYQDLPETRSSKNRRSDRKEKIVMFLGRIHRIKGIDLLVVAFSELIKDRDDVRLVLIGPDDGDLSQVKDLVERENLHDRVTVLPPMYGLDKLDAYREADVLVYPAKHEIFGLVPFEALMCGTPVVVSDGCGCGEVIREAQCGELFASGDSTSLSWKIRTLLDNPDEGEAMVMRGQTYIRKNLGWNRLVHTFESLYNDVLEVPIVQT
jgi:glycosyltransferase involved in cell wall biosynthesis